MPDKSGINALPATYRLGLSLSLALFIHTLILSGVPTPLEEQAEAHRESVRFELVSPGARETVASATGNPGQESTPIPPFELDPVTPATPSKPEVVTTRAPETPPPSQSPANTSPSTEPTQTSTPARQGKKPEQDPEDVEQSITRITESPAEMDPYVVKLAVHLARRLEDLKIPAMRELTETVTMEVELQLLGNGALTRARVLKSTGIERIDEAAYRAALAASPYPQPPESNASQNRFEVELLFTPKRL
ncbi:TonB family protein [Marinobacter sp.]|uniref:TonB family protein n=1 Tax=Marinobacter sp. TaxID=50741 RepID=UPI00356220AE